MPRGQWPPPRKVDDTLLQRHGLRKVEGPRLTLITDLPASDEIDALPRVIESAVPLWEERFGLRVPDDWRLQACLIGDAGRFRAARLMPTGHEGYPHGLSIGYELWVNEQETDYYRRHLLLHEATHSFMATQLGGCGPGWYMEGMAELLGQHTWDPETGKLELGVMLPDGHDARSLGRIGLLQQAYRNHQALSIPAVMKIDNSKVLGNESYAWAWALCKLLDTHPKYQERFRKRLPKLVLNRDFNERFAYLYQSDRGDLQTEWRLFIASLEYGHDIAREAIAFQKGAPLTSSSKSVATSNLAAEHGWQSTKILLEAGKQYHLTAEGMFTIAVEPDGKPVHSTADGVTLDYHAGRPLGVLLAAIDPRDVAGQKVAAGAKGGFLRPARLGAVSTFTAPFSGTLYLRVNDSPAKLSDNSGELSVTITPNPPPS